MFYIILYMYYDLFTMTFCHSYVAYHFLHHHCIHVILHRSWLFKLVSPCHQGKCLLFVCMVYIHVLFVLSPCLQGGFWLLCRASSYGCSTRPGTKPSTGSSPPCQRMRWACTHAPTITTNQLHTCLPGNGWSTVRPHVQSKAPWTARRTFHQGDNVFNV